jgi:hypothetical protein
VHPYFSIGTSTQKSLKKKKKRKKRRRGSFINNLNSDEKSFGRASLLQGAQTVAGKTQRLVSLSLSFFDREQRHLIHRIINFPSVSSKL